MNPLEEAIEPTGLEAQINGILAPLRALGLDDEALSRIKDVVSLELSLREPASPITEDTLVVNKRVEVVLADELPDTIKPYYDLIKAKDSKRVHLESLAENRDVVEFLEKMLSVSSDLKKLYAGLDETDNKPSPEWLAEVNGLIDGVSRQNQFLLGFLSDINTLKKTRSINVTKERPLEVIAKDWKRWGARTSHTTVDPAFINQFLVEEVLFCNILLIQLCFEAHKKERPDLKASLSDVEEQFGAGGPIDAAKKMASALGHTYFHHEPYAKKYNDFVISNIHRRCPSISELPREVLKTGQSETLYRVNSPVIHANDDKVFGQFEIATLSFTPDLEQPA